MNTEAIKEILRTALRNKFSKYNPEPGVMPFHTRLLGADRLALYSFIHSLCTNFGTTIFEPVHLHLARAPLQKAKSSSHRIIKSASFPSTSFKILSMD